MIAKCCGFVDIRPGLGILSIFELIAACTQFAYLTCKETTSESRALVGTCSVVGVVGGCLLLFGVIKKDKTAMYVHMLSRNIEMALSISAGVFVFISISKREECSEALQILWGIYFIRKFVSGIYFFCCVYSFYRKTFFNVYVELNGEPTTSLRGLTTTLNN
jgi:hypothetical protein